jgi:hypothetical protein
MRIILLALTLSSFVLAHANLRSSIPAEDTRVRTLPKQIVLNMIEPVEVRVSTFKVYPLSVPADKLSNFKYLNAQARPLFNRVLRLRGDEAQRADSGVLTTTRTSRQVVVGLKPGLKEGAYAVMWQVLSVDGHRTAGWIVYVYKP